MEKKSSDRRLPRSSGLAAYESVKHLVFERGFQRGLKLSERAIAESLGLSRIPVRESLQRLVLEGLLVRSPEKGISLREYNEQDIYDLYNFREPLDGIAARFFTIRAEKIEIHFLQLVYEDMVKTAGDYTSSAWREKDIEFHRVIARGSRNPRIIATLDNVLQECLSLIHSLSRPVGEESGKPPAHLKEVLEEHERILQAIQSGDENLAEKVARQSVQTGLRRLMGRFALHRKGAS